MSNTCEVCGLSSSDIDDYVDDDMLEYVYFERTDGVVHCITCDPTWIIIQNEDEKWD